MAKEVKVIVSGNSSKYERAMRDVQARNKRITSTLKKHWVAFSAAAVVAIMALKKAVTVIINSIKDWVNLSKIQELAEINLAAALKAAGEYTDELNLKYQAFASGIQNVTKYGDEQVLTLMALMKNLGVHSGRVEEATKMAIGLATATDRDVKSMSQYVALAMQGEFTMLRRYIPALRTTTDKTEQLRIVTEFAARGFKVAQEQTSSFAIGLEQLKNLYGDLKEKLGDIITKNEAVIELMKEAKKWLIETNKQVEAWVKNNKELIEQKTHVAINAIADAAKLAAIAVKALGKSFLIFEKVRTGTLNFWKTIIDYWKEAIGLGSRIPSGVTRGWGDKKPETPGAPSPTPEIKLPPPSTALITALEAEGKIIEEAMQKQWEIRQAAKEKELTLLADTLAQEDIIITDALIRQGEIEFEMKEAARTREHEALVAAIDAENTYIEQGLQQQWEKQKRHEENMLTLKVQTAQNWLTFSQNIAATLYQLGDRQSKALFLIQQGFAVAMATASAFQASAMALATPPGPPYTIPLSKAVLALGLANAAAIAALSIKQVSSVGGGGGGGAAIPTYSVSPYTEIPTTPEKKGTTINVYVENFVGEDSYIDSFVEKITQRVEVADINLVATRVKG